jgi:hypothetical protein
LTADASDAVLKYRHAAEVACVTPVAPAYRKHSALPRGTNAKSGRNISKVCTKTKH